MERLTERDEFGNADIIGVDSEDLQLNLDFKQMNKVTDALNKLANYEDLEQQGLILRLPVPIGNTVYNTTWWDDKCEIVTVNGKKYSRSVRKRKVTKSTFGLLDIKEWGKTVFLTQSEAEQKLKEMNDNGITE